MIISSKTETRPSGMNAPKSGNQAEEVTVRNLSYIFVRREIGCCCSCFFFVLGNNRVFMLQVESSMAKKNAQRKNDQKLIHCCMVCMCTHLMCQYKFCDWNIRQREKEFQFSWTLRVLDYTCTLVHLYTCTCT